MLCLVGFLGFLPLLVRAATTGHFKFQGDCGSSNAAMHFSNVVLPNVVPSGDTYNVSAAFTVARDVPGCAQVRTSIHKCWWTKLVGCGYIPWPAGCQDDFGKCTFNVCQRPGFPVYNPLFFACKGTGNGATAGTTIVKAGSYNLNQRTYFVGLEGFENTIVDGTYAIKVEYLDTAGSVIGCYAMDFTVNKFPRPSYPTLTHTV